MAFQLNPCITELCEGIRYSDHTGPYDAADNPFGYGYPSGPTGPADFTSYTLSIWKEGLDRLVDPPTLVVDLLANVPTVDADGFYTWADITLAQLQLSVLTSGEWFFKASAVFDGVTYSRTRWIAFDNDLFDTITAKAVEAPITNRPPVDLAFIMELAVDQNCCGQVTKAQAMFEDLYAQVNLNCC